VLADLVANAPKVPLAELDLGLKLELIDYIDCTDPCDPHDFLDQGTSQVVEGPAGRYRVSAPHRHSFFAYGYKTAGVDQPVLLVMEYPDDARRRFNFSMADSMRPSKAHTSFAPNAGVYTGDPTPLSNQMAYTTLLCWPQDEWSPITAMSLYRSGVGAAASRIWIYAVQEMPPLLTPEEMNGRTLDLFLPLPFQIDRDYFGWNSPNAIEHMADYCRWIGVNRVTVMTYANQTWGGYMNVPAWDVTSPYLDNILQQMDEQGGDIGFIAGIVADGMYGMVTHDGQPLYKMSPDEMRPILFQGLEQIITNYGKYKSFKGIAFGSMETTGFLDTLIKHGLMEEAVTHVKELRPDLEVITYLGSSWLQRPYFMPYTNTFVKTAYAYPTPTVEQVIGQWEDSSKDWKKHLADTVLQNWKNWNQDPAALRTVEGLTLYEKRLPDDHRCIESYRQEPRGPVYFDVLRNSHMGELIDTPYAGLFGTFDESWCGLTQGYNFWWNVHWTSFESNPTGQHALRPYAFVMSDHDRLAISTGSWVPKYFGMESEFRRFARAFHSLPAELMQPASSPDAGVVVRYGQGMVSLLNQAPFSLTARIDDKNIELKAYELLVLDAPEDTVPVVSAVAYDAKYAEILQVRMDEFSQLIESTDAPKSYRQVDEDARALFVKERLYEADLALGHGLLNELRLRDRILSPTSLDVPKLSAAPSFTGNLDDWPAAAFDRDFNDGSELSNHTFFPNSWTGPDDLSARIRLGHDGKRLYIGLLIRDDVVDDDTAKIWLSRSAYRTWASNPVNPEIKVTLPKEGTQELGQAGWRCAATPVEGGTVIEGSWDLKLLRVKSGDHIGFMVSLLDRDCAPTRDCKKVWTLKQSMIIPSDLTFRPWDDIRCGGELNIQ